jgi:phosphatidylglycerol:prolipoprotein diacylglycerol transferase
MIEISINNTEIKDIFLSIFNKIILNIVTLPHIIENYEFYSSDKETMLYSLFGGYVFYGGLIGGIIMGMVYGKIFKINPIKLVDIYAPLIPLIHGFGRVGCFFAGCCYGAPSEKYGVYFDALGGAPLGVKLFPIQLVEAGINFIVFAVLLIFAIKKIFKLGGITGAYLSIYAVERFILEFFRYDSIRGGLLGISTSQWISIILFPIGIALILFGKKIFKEKTKDTQ